MQVVNWQQLIQNWKQFSGYCVLDIDKNKPCLSHLVGSFGQGRRYRRGKNRCKHCGYRII
jgi:hypothetical protein